MFWYKKILTQNYGCFEIHGAGDPTTKKNSSKFMKFVNSKKSNGRIAGNIYSIDLS